MSVTTYTPSNKIIHQIKVDLIRRDIPSVIHIVQGDMTLPIIEVKVYRNGSIFDIASFQATDINVRCVKSDFSTVYAPVLGVSTSGTSLYFEISKAMSDVYGRASAVIELKRTDDIINSSPFYLDIDPNPVWDDEPPKEYGGVSFEAIENYFKVVQFEVID